ncbi:Hypothetical protein CpPa08_0022 [Corynebacterium pseudotuberculosis]|nr:Hypothetical protein Cp267_0029 [Corynebacterium pseudotuberculosis 267]AQU91723.1 Hypothetical protein CpMIC6_0032 [Corynebacterium pseudotuberculosis]ATQ64353.1 Hypothetical protein CpPA07_0023 [Corynebacterium pseudotuberculosis]ATQ80338.1 Hypothetical protein CpPa08_0022 [Corynebacterium pseudotuberculosis]
MLMVFSFSLVVFWVSPAALANRVSQRPGSHWNYLSIRGEKDGKTAQC